MQDNHWDSIDEYYKSQGILTVLKPSEKNMTVNVADIDFFCDIVTNQTVVWNKSSRWINITESTILEDNSDVKSQLSSSSIQKESKHDNTFKRERLRGKSEFDFVEHITTINAKLFSNILLHSQSSQINNIDHITSSLFFNQLRGDDVSTMGRIWVSLENLFLETLENCFFYRRILLSEQEPHIVTVKNILNGLLKTQNTNKIELIKQLQFDLSKVPLNKENLPSNIKKQLFSALSDVRVLLIQKTNSKIEKCKQFIEREIAEYWLDKQMYCIFAVHKCMLQAEVSIIKQFVFELFF